MQAQALAGRPVPENYFAQLSAINVNGHVEKKGGFSYLSWPYAVAQLRLADPSATWEVRRFGGLPSSRTITLRRGLAFDHIGRPILVSATR